jgi:hypothetical protein
VKLNSFSVSHVKYQPLNTYHVLVGSAGLTHVVQDFTVCVCTCVHHILSNINLTQSSHNVPFHTYHDSLHVNFAYKLLHADTVSHVDNGFQEKSDVVYHPLNVESTLVGVQSVDITQLSIEITAFHHPSKCISSVEIDVALVFTAFFTQRTDLALERQSAFGISILSSGFA